MSVRLSVVLALVCSFCRSAQGDVEVRVDYSHPNGAMLPLHGVNNAPMELDGRQHAFAAAGIPFCRTHDTAGAYGGAHFVDIPNVFPDFDADETNVASYDFALTDAWLGTVVASGTEPFYRLGVTIEGGRRMVRPYHIFPPRDAVKWARVCEHVIKHYTEGWANGKRWKMRYWEIWNEPDNPDMWQGTMEQYFALYGTVARHLKACFPHLKIGGYASCGFDELERKIDPRWANGSYLEWFRHFVDYVNAPMTRCPLDFFSWHVYTDDPERVARFARYCRTYLDEHGLADTETILDEWNFINHEKYGRDEFTLMKEMPGATFVASVFCLLQRDRTVSSAMYYDALPTRAYCGLYYFPSLKTTPCYEAFRLFNRLYSLGTSVAVSVSGRSVYACAATDGRERALLLVNNRCEPVRIRLAIAGGAKPFRADVTWLSEQHPNTDVGQRWHPDDALDMSGLSVSLVAFSCCQGQHESSAGMK